MPVGRITDRMMAAHDRALGSPEYDAEEFPARRENSVHALMTGVDALLAVANSRPEATRQLTLLLERERTPEEEKAA